VPCVPNKSTIVDGWLDVKMMIPVPPILVVLIQKGKCVHRNVRGGEVPSKGDHKIPTAGSKVQLDVQLSESYSYLA
jgi:hypothetical protein